jgi:signal transduction histidine kinase
MLKLHTFSGVPAATAEAVRQVPFGEGIGGMVALHRQRMVLNEVQSSAAVKTQFIKSIGVEAYACHPLMVEGRVLGTLSFGSRTRKYFWPDELEFFQTLCYYLALALDRRRLAQETARRATELEAAQRELEAHATRLTEMVHDRTASLNASLKSMEELLYTIAHDLRAPNRAMEGMATIALEQYGPKLDAVGQGLLRQISESAVKNDCLIQDLLEYGRLAHADFPLQTVDLGSAVRHALTDLERDMRDKEAIIHLPEHWAKVLGNARALNQILTNLLFNALKFMPQGRRPELTVSVEHCQGRVLLSLKDNGIGIPSEHWERVFEPFARLAQA